MSGGSSGYQTDSPPLQIGLSVWVRPGLDSALLIEERVEGSNTSKMAL